MKEISDIQRRIVTLFEARGAGQMRAALGDMRTGMGGFRREIRDARTDVGMLDRQWRAFGTTIRYALAGSTIFGGVALVGQLNQVQQSLGLVSAISPTAFDGVRLAGEQLEKFGEQAEDAALRSNVPISEFNAGLVNLVSTVQNVPQNRVVPMLEQISQTARLSQTPVDEATKGVLGLAVAFEGVEGVNMKNIQRFLAEYQRMIFTVPGGAAAGPQLIQQLPQLAAVSLGSNFTPEQMFGVLTTVLRAGGQPSTAARGLQYLIQGIGTPASPKSAKAMASIGITPNMVQQEGGAAALLRMIQAVREGGFGGRSNDSIRRQLRGMTDEQLDSLTGEGGLGITGTGAELSRALTGRVHAQRALILLAADEKLTVKDIQMMVRLGRNHRQQVEELRSNWQAFEDEAQLQKVGLAVNAMALDIAQLFEPVLNFAGGGLIKAQQAVDRVTDDINNDALAAGIVGGAGAIVLSKTVRKGMRGGVRGIGPAHAAYSQITALGDPDSARGSSPGNPLFVAIAYSLSGWGRNATYVGTPGGAGPGGRGNPGAPARGRMGRFGKFAGAGAGLGILGVGLMGILDEESTGGGIRTQQRKITDQSRVDKVRAVQMAFEMNRKFGTPLSKLIGNNPLLEKYGQSLDKTVMNRVDAGYLSEGNALKILGKHGINVKGKAEITVRVEQPGIRPKTSKHIVDFAPDFTGTAPQTRGQKTTRRGG